MAARFDCAKTWIDPLLIADYTPLTSRGSPAGTLKEFKLMRVLVVAMITMTFALLNTGCSKGGDAAKAVNPGAPQGPGAPNGKPEGAPSGKVPKPAGVPEQANVPKENLILGVVNDPAAVATPYDGIYSAGCHIYSFSDPTDNRWAERVLHLEKGYYMELTYVYSDLNCQYDEHTELYESVAKIQIVGDSINSGFKKADITYYWWVPITIKEIIKLEANQITFSDSNSTKDSDGYPLGGSTTHYMRIK